MAGIELLYEDSKPLKCEEKKYLSTFQKNV